MFLRRQDIDYQVCQNFSTGCLQLLADCVLGVPTAELVDLLIFIINTS
jgi:hypothetical protein